LDSLSKYDIAIPPVGVAMHFNEAVMPLLEKIKQGIKEVKH
jgi:hypothetical protein